MSSNTLKPYLIQGFYTWCGDYHFTPMIEARKDARNTLPDHLLSEDTLIFDIHPEAVKDLSFGKDGLAFQARFSGKVASLFIHYDTVSKVFVKENGEGLVFSTLVPSNHSQGEHVRDGATGKNEAGDPKRKRHLQLVKPETDDKAPS